MNRREKQELVESVLGLICTDSDIRRAIVDPVGNRPNFMVRQ
jgi:hypothetical protein